MTGVPPSGSGHSPRGGAAKASPAKPSVPNAPAFTPDAAEKLFAWAMQDARIQNEALEVITDDRLADVSLAPEVMDAACHWARSVIRVQRREGGEEIWPSATDALSLAQLLLAQARGEQP